MNLGLIRSATLVLIGLMTFAGCGNKEQASSENRSSDEAETTISDANVKPASHTAEPGDSNSLLPEREPKLMPAQGNAAVIDLNRVAIGLNRLEGFDNRLQSKRQELEAQIKILEEGYQEEIDDLLAKIEETGTDDIQSIVSDKEQERDLNLAEARRQAAQKLLQFEEIIKREFMDEVRPVAFQVAQDNGFGVVFTVPQVFAYQVGSQVDITDRVVEQMQVTNPSRPNPALPRLASPIPSDTKR